jgi:signal transduction histidine kinase
MNPDKNELAETSAFLVSVISSAPYGILAVNKKGEITIANYLAREYLELPYNIKELPGKNIQVCINHIPELQSIINKNLKTSRRYLNIDAFQYSDKYLNIRGRPIHKGYIITIENVTRVKEMEAVALNSMLEGQEQERKRIAKEIHDGLGPMLSTIKLHLESIRTDLKDCDQHILLKKIKSTFKLIDGVAADMRNISRRLMPKVLVDFGLPAALENLCQHVDESNKLKINYYKSGFTKRFDDIIELGIYRIGQELIHNAIKHSNASVINVQLIKHPESIVLMVEDNGKGFDEQARNPKNRGLGLINIESRAKALGGEFFIDSVEGKGVTATIEIPVENELNSDINKEMDSRILNK